MAKKKKAKAKSETADPKYPYTSAPADLRRLLQLIPQKPKPPKLATSTANTWGIKSTGVGTTITVLKKVGLLDPGGVPTPEYAVYMTPGGGRVLAQKIKEIYKELFELLPSPQNASQSDLKNFFNIHSGGSEVTIDCQIRTFKTLAEFANFDGVYTPPPPQANGADNSQPASGSNSSRFHFDLHIHLPEGKSTADYEAILKSLSENIISKIKS